MNAINLKASENHRRPRQSVRVISLDSRRGPNHLASRKTVSLTDSREQKGERNQLQATECFSLCAAGKKVIEKSRVLQTEHRERRAGTWKGRGVSECRGFLAKRTHGGIFTTACRYNLWAFEKAALKFYFS